MKKALKFISSTASSGVKAIGNMPSTVSKSIKNAPNAIATKIVEKLVDKITTSKIYDDNIDVFGKTNDSEISNSLINLHNEINKYYNKNTELNKKV